MTERALTIRQPWADLIMAGVKDVENRTWRVPSTVARLDHKVPPFRLWVHAGQRVERGALDGWDMLFVATGRQRNQYDWNGRTGALLGLVSVTGCHHAGDCEDMESTEARWPWHCSRWAEPDVWHWTLADPEPLPEPVPMRGAQGLWKLDPPVPASTRSP